MFKLWVLGLDTLQLDGSFFTRNDVGSEVDVTKTATADPTVQAVL